jgi:hypothetical protein
MSSKEPAQLVSATQAALKELEDAQPFLAARVQQLEQQLRKKQKRAEKPARVVSHADLEDGAPTLHGNRSIAIIRSLEAMHPFKLLQQLHLDAQEMSNTVLQPDSDVATGLCEQLLDSLSTLLDCRRTAADKLFVATLSDPFHKSSTITARIFCKELTSMTATCFTQSCWQVSRKRLMLQLMAFQQWVWVLS